MTKEGCNGMGHRLQSGERFLDGQTKVELVGDGVLGDIRLDVLPDLLVGIELGRVRRQVDEFEAALGGLDVGLDGLGLMDAVAVHDQDDGLCVASNMSCCRKRSNTSALTDPSWIMNCMAPSRPMAEIIWIEVRAPVLRTMGVLPMGPQVVPQW